jgi:hypothetical protein
VTSTVARHCYQLIIVATDKDVMSPEPVTTESHSSDRQFGDIATSGSVTLLRSHYRNRLQDVHY